MRDATRKEVAQWCIKNDVDFTAPLFPPPDGWLWAETCDPDSEHILTAIFTNVEDADICSMDVAMAADDLDKPPESLNRRQNKERLLRDIYDT